MTPLEQAGHGHASRTFEPSPEPRAQHATRALLPLLAAMLLLGGCASGGSLRAPPETTVPLGLHASGNLNASDDDPGQATIVRIYRLRGVTRFEQAPLAVLMVRRSAS